MKRAKTQSNIQIEDERNSNLLVSIPQAGVYIYPKFITCYQSALSNKQTIPTIASITNTTQQKSIVQPDSQKSKVKLQSQTKTSVTISLVDNQLVFEIIQTRNIVRLQNITSGKEVLHFTVNNIVTLKTVQSIFRNKLCEIGFQKKYIVQQQLGKGGTSEVFVAKRITDNKKFAVKIVSLKASDEKNYKIFINEIQILRKLNHPNIIKLQSIYYYQKKFYAVLEYFNGGTLLQQMRDNFPQNKDHKCSIIFDILKGLQHLRQKTIVHRDLKLQNILIRNNADGTCDYVLSDFGLASFVNEKHPLFEKCGTPGYIAPQVLLSTKNNTPITHKSDIFSFGVIIHYILFGRPVFKVENNDAKELMEQNKKFKIDFNKPCYRNLTQIWKKLIDVSLSIDLSKRYSSDQILQFMYPSLYYSSEQYRKNRKLKMLKIQTKEKQEEKTKSNLHVLKQETEKIVKFYSMGKLQQQSKRSRRSEYLQTNAKKAQIVKPQSFSKNKLESKEVKTSFIKGSLAKSLEKLTIRSGNSRDKNTDIKPKKNDSLVDEDKKQDISFIGNIWEKLTGKKNNSSQDLHKNSLKKIQGK